MAERAFLNRLDSGCQFPVAANAGIMGNVMTLYGLVASMDGAKILSDSIRDDHTRAEQLAVELADRLIARGALKLLSEN